MSIKLEIGKKYVCRNGAVVGPLENRENASPYNFTHNFGRPNKQFGNLIRVSWDENGVWHRDHPNNDRDIVAEYHEYVWKWMVPDKPGVWMFGGCSRDITERNRISVVLDISTWPEGWYCFLMDIPSIQMPPKQRVTKRLWLRKNTCYAILRNESTSDFENVEAYEERWEPNGITPEDGRWISTNVTKEFEE